MRLFPVMDELTPGRKRVRRWRPSSFQLDRSRLRRPSPLLNPPPGAAVNPYHSYRGPRFQVRGPGQRISKLYPIWKPHLYLVSALSDNRQLDLPETVPPPALQWGSLRHDTSDLVHT